MVWFVLNYFGILSNCLENVLDKKGLMLTNLNDYLTSAIRLWLYFFILWIFYYFLNGYFLTPTFNIVYIIFGVLSSFNSIAYSHILNKNQTTLLALIPIVVPIFFLLFELILGIDFNMLSIFGILITIIGGYIFLNIKSIYFSKKTIFMFLLMFIYIITEIYFVKDFYIKNNINPLEFFFNLMIISASISTIVYINYLSKTKEKINYNDLYKYLYISFFAKLFDVLATYFYFGALLLTTFAYYSAFSLLYLPTLLFFLFFIQKYLKIDLQEKFDKKSTFEKIIGTILIIIGQLILIFNK